MTFGSTHPPLNTTLLVVLLFWIYPSSLEHEFCGLTYLPLNMIFLDPPTFPWIRLLSSHPTSFEHDSCGPTHYPLNITLLNPLNLLRTRLWGNTRSQLNTTFGLTPLPFPLSCNFHPHLTSLKFLLKASKRSAQALHIKPDSHSINHIDNSNTTT